MEGTLVQCTWGGKNTHLNVLVHVAEHIVDLLFEASTQHLVGFIQNKSLDVRRA